LFAPFVRLELEKEHVKEQKSFDAFTLVLDSLLVNGFLPMDADIPPSILDDFKILTSTLDDFFRVEK